MNIQDEDIIHVSVKNFMMISNLDNEVHFEYF